SYALLSRLVAFRADMIRIVSTPASSHQVCAKSSSARSPAIPIVCQRSSPSVMRSHMLRASGSSKNRLAESKSIPCFRKLSRFLTSSHSKRNRQYHFVCTDGGRQESQGF